MKTFVCRIRGHRNSEWSAARTMTSIRQYRGWDPVYFDGWTPDTLPDELKWEPQENSRAADHRRNSPVAYPFKQACAMNHLRVALHCMRIQEPVAYIEHDARCLGDWTQPDFDGVLIMNAHDAVLQTGLQSTQDLEDSGVHAWTWEQLKCRHRFDRGYTMPGLAAYAMTPDAARALIEDLLEHGWEQGDFMINANLFPIDYVSPPFFDFHSSTMKTSHGF